MSNFNSRTLFFYSAARRNVLGIEKKPTKTAFFCIFLASKPTFSAAKITLLYWQNY